MFDSLYRWTLRLAESRHAPLALGCVAFAESSFFPIPPDLILVPMALARPRRAWVYASICTVASVVGGILGYGIGALLYDTVGHWLIHLYGYGDKVEAFREAYARWGTAIILIKGLTPIPYKIVTITSGFAGYDLFWFVVLSLITRGARFFILAGLVGRYGVGIRTVLDRHLNAVAAVFGAVCVLGFVGFRYLF